MHVDSVVMLTSSSEILILIFAAVYDIKERTIPIWLIIAGLLIGLVEAIAMLITNQKDIISLLIMLIPGVLIVAIGALGNKSIGKGDGYIMLIMGELLSIQCFEIAILMAVMLCFLFCVVLYVLKKVNRTSQIPFVPFLMIGSVIGITIV